MLWLALRFPTLLLDDKARGLEAPPPMVLVVRETGRSRVEGCNQPARDMGVCPGSWLNSAFALAPELVAVPFEAHRSEQLLTNLAELAYGYSSLVTLESPDLLLLELSGSVRLFGTLKRLLNKILDEFRTLGFEVSYGVAPTPLGARLLAERGAGLVATSDGDFNQLLTRMPLQHLALDAAAVNGFEKSGFRYIGELLSLPRGALQRRFGAEVARYLSRLSGREADPRPRFEPPQLFRRTLDLPAEVHATPALRFAVGRLLRELAGYLDSRGLGARKLVLGLQHYRKPSSRIELGFVAPAGGFDHLQRIVDERLGRQQLSAPVVGLTLECDSMAPLDQRQGELLSRPGVAQRESPEALFDLLRSRLGHRAVRGVQVRPQHVPEMASRVISPSSGSPAWQGPRRPLWLLPEPRLAVGLTIEGEAERIESGWWSPSDVRRDYYIAHNRSGGRYWVFRARSAPDQLFIHGIFA
ncbi:MAG: DNA polymerase Y family protein [Gammaproteobacteria bacterium]|nr:DNA polymerase Y family protein [Gammaproteobacteria bacterium]